MGERPDESLQLPRDDRHQRHEWRLETVAWVIIAAVLLAALAGLVGPGPLSDATVEAGVIRLDYERFSHYQAPQRLRFRLSPSAAADGQVRLWLDRAFVEAIEIHQVDPWPAMVEAEAGRYIWVLRSTRPGEEMVATIRYVPDFIGCKKVRAGIDGGSELSFWQFVYP